MSGGWLFFEGPGQIIIPTPFYALVAVAYVTWRCFRGDKGSRAYRVRFVALSLFLWSWAVLTPAVLHFALQSWESQFTAVELSEISDGNGLEIVVLGAGDVLAEADGSYRAVMDDVAWARTEAGVALWEKTRGTVYFAGGLPGPGELTTARVMGRAAATLGLPSDRIVLEQRSANTFENLAEFANGRSGREFWLVTSALHMPRAIGVARSLGLNPRPFPCDYRGRDALAWHAWLPHNSVAHDAVPLLHEMVGTGVYKWRGYID